MAGVRTGLCVYEPVSRRRPFRDFGKRFWGPQTRLCNSPSASLQSCLRLAVEQILAKITRKSAPLRSGSENAGCGKMTGADYQNRTDDLPLTKRLLYRAELNRLTGRDIFSSAIRPSKTRFSYRLQTGFASKCRSPVYVSRLSGPVVRDRLADERRRLPFASSAPQGRPARV